MTRNTHITLQVISTRGLEILPCAIDEASWIFTSGEKSVPVVKKYNQPNHNLQRPVTYAYLFQIVFDDLATSFEMADGILQNLSDLRLFINFDESMIRSVHMRSALCLLMANYITNVK